MGQTDDEAVANYGKKPPEEGEKKVEIVQISIKDGLERIAKGGWFLDRYRSALSLKESGPMPNDQIFIVNDEEEASRRYDTEKEEWVSASNRKEGTDG